MRSGDSLQTLLECLKDIHDWIRGNFLQLNNTKNGSDYLYPLQIPDKFFTDLCSLTPFTKPSAEKSVCHC